ncbi:MAG: Wzz/FepE/Etk N-terminal domain-containing protein [Roseiarcus sp.]|jgi:uncharacterized protein involved in exopolysaccharide biosynthesis
MSASLKAVPREIGALRVHREQVARETLKALWRGKWLVVASFCVAFAVAVAALLLVPPRYTATATIQFNFDRDQSGAEATKNQPVAILDPYALVGDAAHNIRSRAVAAAVVARLELDRDPHFVGLPVSWRALAAMRLALRLGAPQIAPFPRELAIAALMNRVTVTNEPRSYLISISFSANDPERAAIVANTVALEYLRAETAERVDRRLAAAEQEAATVSLVYGSQHPARQHSEEKLKRLRESLDALRRGSDLADSSKFDGGSSLIPAQRDDVPSNPDVNLALGLASLVGLAIGVWMALYLRGSTAVGTCDELRGDPPARGAALRAQSR